MEYLLSNIEWVPVLVSFVVAFILGFLWYSPLMFAKKWQAGIGIAPDDQSPMMWAMITQIGGTFFLAILVNAISVPVALLAMITISTIIKANGLFTKKTTYAIAVEAGFIWVMVISMIAVNHWL